jgi:hypothetical protein
MTSYLVRIYRRAENNPGMLVGIIEETGIKEKKVFSNLYELWDILNPTRREMGRLKKSKTKIRTQNNPR